MMAMGDWVGALRNRGRRMAKRALMVVERRYDEARLARRADGAPQHFRIATFGGHGNRGAVVVRGRALDNPEPPAATEGEGVWAAVRRTISHLSTIELPGVPLRASVGDGETDVVTDGEGYFKVRFDPNLETGVGPWVVGEVGLAEQYRGLTDPHSASLRVRIPGPKASFGVISDVDDTILHTGAQRLFGMIRRTVTGSALTRTPLAGAPELYRALARGDANPIFYVSSSPWNLHAFLTGFLDHRGFPPGPLLLRDLLGTDPYRTRATTKHNAIAEVLDLHPDLPFVLIGDSGEHDPEIYADVIRRNPGRILATYIREVRLDPGDGRVEAITDAWAEDTPFVLAPDSAVMADHAAGLGLISANDAETVRAATRAET
jgi:phosphatidate phosphatase APP1